MGVVVKTAKRVLAVVRLLLDVLLSRLFMLLQPRLQLDAAVFRNKIAVITGCTSGIGAETAHRLLNGGAVVVMACRATAAAQALVNQWREAQPFDGIADVMPIDLTNFDSITTFAEAFHKKYPRLDLLINNAGIFDMFGKQREATSDGYESHLQVNFLAPVMLTRLMLPALLCAEQARVLNVSSSIHKLGVLDLDNINLTQGWSPIRAYAGSKLLQVIFSRECANRLRGSPIKVISFNPGNVVTEVARTLPAWIRYLYRSVGGYILITAFESAQAVCYLAGTDAITSGGYYSYCVLTPPHPAAEDDVCCRKVWLAACNELGLDEEWLRADGTAKKQGSRG